MPVPPTWQALRTSFLPIAESILGPSIRRHSIRVVHPSIGARPSTTAVCRRSITTHTGDRFGTDGEAHKEVRQRKKQVDESNLDLYPRFAVDRSRHLSLHGFLKKYNKDENISEASDTVEVHGRISAVRKSSSKLVFIDIVETRSQKLQIVCDYSYLEGQGVPRSDFTKITQLMRRGDIISMHGVPYRTNAGQLSLKITQVPTVLTPCLRDFPEDKSCVAGSTAEREWQRTEKHVQMLTNVDSVNTIFRRAQVVHHMREFFRMQHFVEVQTPILAASAGGAAARPFETSAAEFPDRKLALRIAPELWLKRLIIGGLTKIYEIGPCFRNEGLDKTHNPEFTSCEFYAAYMSLPELISTTESLLSYIQSMVHNSLEKTASPQPTGIDPSVPPPYPLSSLEGSYSQIDFIPALNAALDVELPNLSNPDLTTLDMILSVFESKQVPIPENPTLPRLLDKLCSSFLEPECQQPTWIKNIPECLSPLSKSFIHPTAPNHQPVAARAELFIAGREIVNCYEEENDPFEQSRKFKMQTVYAQAPAGKRSGQDGPPEIDPEVMKLDEDYLRAMEWGLPPTGGWGCGVDRLVMLLTGKDKIGDVLSFGNLRAVTRGADKFEREGGPEK